MGNRKYVLTDETKKVENRILHRIKAVKDFDYVHVGDLGGWVESEDNLSQFGNCWVYDDAMVLDEAKVFDDAKIRDKAAIYGWAIVCGKAMVSDHANVCDHAIITNEAIVSDNAMVRDRAKVSENAFIHEMAWIRDNAWVYDNADVCHDAIICDYARVKSKDDYAVYENHWSSGTDGRSFTWTRCNNMWKVGGFFGTGEELIKKAYEDNETWGKCYEAIVKAQEIISKNLNY